MTAKFFRYDFRYLFGIARSHDQYGVYRVHMIMIRGYNGKMGGRGLLALLKGCGINNISSKLADDRCRSQSKALVAGTPYT